MNWKNLSFLLLPVFWFGTSFGQKPESYQIGIYSHEKFISSDPLYSLPGTLYDYLNVKSLSSCGLNFVLAQRYLAGGKVHDFSLGYPDSGNIWLDRLECAKIKVIVGDAPFSDYGRCNPIWTTSPPFQTPTNGMLTYYNHSNIYGYYMVDEPCGQIFPKILNYKNHLSTFFPKFKSYVGLYGCFNDPILNPGFDPHYQYPGNYQYILSHGPDNPNYPYCLKSTRTTLHYNPAIVPSGPDLCFDLDDPLLRTDPVIPVPNTDYFYKDFLNEFAATVGADRPMIEMMEWNNDFYAGNAAGKMGTQFKKKQTFICYPGKDLSSQYTTNHILEPLPRGACPEGSVVTPLGDCYMFNFDEFYRYYNYLALINGSKGLFYWVRNCGYPNNTNAPFIWDLGLRQETKDYLKKFHSKLISKSDILDDLYFQSSFYHTYSSWVNHTGSVSYTSPFPRVENSKTKWLNLQCCKDPNSVVIDDPVVYAIPTSGEDFPGITKEMDISNYSNGINTEAIASNHFDFGNQITPIVNSQNPEGLQSLTCPGNSAIEIANALNTSTDLSTISFLKDHYEGNYFWLMNRDWNQGMEIVANIKEFRVIENVFDETLCFFDLLVGGGTSTSALFVEHFLPVEAKLFSVFKPTAMFNHIETISNYNNLFGVIGNAGSIDVGNASVSVFYGISSIGSYKSPEIVLTNCEAKEGADIKFKAYSTNCYQPSFKKRNKEDKYQSGLSLFPNPTEQFVSIKFNSKEEGATTLRLYDEFGRIALEATDLKEGYAFEKKLDLKGLISGIYFLELICGDEIKGGKVIKL